MKLINKQKGMSSLLLLFVLSSAGFFMLCAFKLIPSYAEDRYIQEALKSLGESSQSIDEMTTRQIKSALSRHYMLNNVRSEGAQQIKVERTNKGTIVHIDYEIRVPLFINMSVVMNFENYLHSAKPLECCKPPREVGKK